MKQNCGIASHRRSSEDNEREKRSKFAAYLHKNKGSQCEGVQDSGRSKEQDYLKQLIKKEKTKVMFLM